MPFDPTNFLQNKIEAPTKTVYKTVDNSGYSDPIDNELLKSLRKYNQGSLSINSDNQDVYTEARARNQSTLERIGHVFAQTAGEFVGGSIEGIGSLISFIPRLVSNNEAFTRNFLEKLGNDINEGIRDWAPIYMTQKAQTGSLLERMQGGGYWAQLMPSVFGSALSIMVPARGASMLLNKLGKLGVQGLSKSQRAAKLFKLAETMQQERAISKIKHFNDVISSAVISRTLDSSREALGTYEEQKQWFYDNYENFVKRDENGNAILTLDNREVKVDNSNIDRLAHEYADKAAARGYWNSMGNIVYDLVEWTGIMGAANTISRATRQNLRKALMKGDKYAVVRALNAIPAEANRELFKNAGRFIYGSGAEMLDEITMSIAMNEGVHSAKKEYGFLSEREDFESFGGRLANYLTDPDVLTEGIGGLLGGAGMQVVMPFIERKINKGVIARENAYQKALEQSVEAMRAGIDNITESLANGDIVSAKQQEIQSVIEQVAANSLDGSLDFYIEMLKGMDASMQHIMEIKNRKDKNQAITDEEQIALDKAGNLIDNPNVFKEMLNKIELIKPIFERNYNSVDTKVSEENQSVLYEIARRKAVYESHKALLKAELDNLEADNNAYIQANQEADDSLDTYINRTYNDEEIQAEKKLNLTEYRDNLNKINTYDKLTQSIAKQTEDLKNKIESIDDALEQVKPEEAHTIGKRLKLAKQVAQNKLDVLAKQSSSINNTNNKLKDRNAELLRDSKTITSADINAITESNTLLSNKADIDGLKSSFLMRNAILDKELEYLGTKKAFDDIKEDIKLYKDSINQEVDKELREKLDSYDSSEELEKHKNEFESDEKAKKAYDAKLKQLQKEEQNRKEREAREQAGIAARSNEVLREEATKRGVDIPIEVANQNQEPTLTDVDDDFVNLFEDLRSEAQQNNISIKDYITSKLSNANDETKAIYNKILDYIDNVSATLNYSFENDHSSNINMILQALLTKYSNSKIPYGRVITENIGNETIEFNPRNYSTIEDAVFHFLTYLNSVMNYRTEHNESGSPIRSKAMIDDRFGTKFINKDKIIAIRDRFINEAKQIQSRYNKIENAIKDALATKNPNTELYVRINGIEHKILRTENRKDDIGLVVEDFDEQINPYTLVPESDQDAINADYVLIEKKRGSAPVRTSFPTGGSKATISATEQTTQIPEQSNIIDTIIETSDENNGDTSNIIEVNIDKNLGSIKVTLTDTKSNSNIEDLVFKLATNGDISKISEGLVATIHFISSILKNKSYKINPADIVNKYIGKKDYTTLEEVVLKAAEVFESNFNSNLSYFVENGYVLSPKSGINYNNVIDAINSLKKLYKGKSGETKFILDTESLSNVLNEISNNDTVSKFAEVLVGDLVQNPENVEARLSSLLSKDSLFVSEGISDEFVTKLGLLLNLMTYINEIRGFKSTKVNMYDLITGLRMYRGDNYDNLIQEILSIINVTKYVKRELELKTANYFKEWQAAKTKDTKEYFKNTYNQHNAFYKILDIEGEYTDLKDEADIIRFLERNPIVSFGKAHSGLDIAFDIENNPNVLFNEAIVEDLGIYEILNKLDTGTEVELVQTNNTDNPNQATYDIIYTDSDTGKQYKLGSMPTLHYIKNGVSYVVKGNNNVHNVRKFEMNDDDARIFAEYQNILYKFMYNYSIAYEPRNNVSEKEIEESDNAIEHFFDLFKTKDYDKLRNAFKRVIYGNLNVNQINDVIKSGISSPVIDGKFERVGEVKLEQCPLALEQMYQICKDMFAGVIINKAMGIGDKTYLSIQHTFSNSVNKHNSIFKHNQGIRGDIKVTNNLKMKISDIGAGRVIVNDASKREENASNRGIDIDHHRASLINTLKPCKLTETYDGKARPMIIQIDENGYAYDPKGKQFVPLDKFATKHIGDQFIANRGTMRCVIPQTDNLYTTFPVKPNTIIGSITDNSIEVRADKLNKYVNYIREAILEILNLKDVNIADARIQITDRLQNIIICNESSAIDLNDINFQSNNNPTGDQVSVMFKTTLGANVKPVYHKFIKIIENDKNYIRYYAGTNRINVGNFAGSTGNPSYKGVISYDMDNEQDMKKLNSVLNSNIPYLTRQFGMYNGLAIAKDKPNTNMETYSNGYIDPITGDHYDSIYDYYMNTNAVYSDLGAVKDTQGNVISNVSLVGTNPIKFSITSSEFEDSDAEYTQTFYSAVDSIKSVQSGDTKEDWKSISEIETILEEEAGIRPVYIIHRLADSKITQTGRAKPRKVHDGTEILPRGFNINSYRVDINYNTAFEASHPHYLTKTLVHEMLHTYMMKHYNVTKSDLNNPDTIKQKEALIQYHNEKVTEWINDFIMSIEAAKKRIKENPNELSKEDTIIRAALNSGETNVINQLIRIFTEEASLISDNINKLLEDRAKGADVIINGEQTLQEVFTYAFSEPTVYAILNNLKSVSERNTEAEKAEIPTLWQKLLNVIKNIFGKIFGISDTEVKEGSSLERLVDVINDVFNTNYTDVDIQSFTIGTSLNLATPSREENEDRSGTNSHNDEIKTTIEEPKTNESVSTEEPVRSKRPRKSTNKDANIKAMDVLDNGIDIDSLNLITASEQNKSDRALKYLFKNKDYFDKNINFDETNRIIC